MMPSCSSLWIAPVVLVRKTSHFVFRAAGGKDGDNLPRQELTRQIYDFALMSHAACCPTYPGPLAVQLASSIATPQYLRPAPLRPACYASSGQQTRC
jgi:hypothetical protein